jgi:hypothetical protein
VSVDRTFVLLFGESLRGFYDELRENLSFVLMLQILPEQALEAFHPLP